MMHPELVAALRGRGPASKIHEHCDYLASRGASGLGALKGIVAQARRTERVFGTRRIGLVAKPFLTSGSRICVSVQELCHRVLFGVSV